MIIKVVIVLFLLTILGCMGSALYFLLSGRGGSTSLVKALTWRITLSLVLFALLMIGFVTGVIQPHPFQAIVPVH